LDFHKFLYCTNDWCWNNGKHNSRAILSWLRGEPNNDARRDEDCGCFLTFATSDTVMRGSQATLHTGLNDCPCEPHNFGLSMPVVLCSRDPIPLVSYPRELENAQRNGNSRFGFEVTFVLAFIALVGWVLFLYFVAAHRQVSLSTLSTMNCPSWLRFWNIGARGSRVRPFSLNGLFKLITNREHNELKATASAARSVSEEVPNVSSTIGHVVESTQAEHYVSPPVQLRQNKPEVLQENDYESANKYTRKHGNKDGNKARKVGSYNRLVEENDDNEL
jgi:hypothetical protein